VVGTFLAAIVALLVSNRVHQERRSERLESEARAAGIVHQNLEGIIRLIPGIVDLIAKSDGVLTENPGTEVIYGIDICRSLVEREAFCHQLPISYVGRGEFVCSLARQWCAEIEVRRQTQRDPEFKALVSSRNYDFVCSLGYLLHSEAVCLQDHCQSTIDKYKAAKAANAPFLQRVFTFDKSVRWIRR
jgi:hypothetical protein